MMKKILLGILSLIMISCIKDKGNYDYNEVNRVSVLMEDSVFTVQQMTELVVKPKLVESVLNSGATYSHEWTVYPTSSDLGSSANEPIKPIFLSNEQDLKTNITLSPRDYYLQYAVTNTQTGLQTLKRYLLTVNGAFYEGWLVMANVNNQAKLSFIRKDNELFLDPIKELNNFDLEGKGLKVYSAVASGINELMVFTDRTSYRFNAIDFRLMNNDSEIFFEKLKFTTPYYTVNSINTDQYVINGGNVYATVAPGFGGNPGKFSTSFSGADAEVFPHFFSGSRYYNSFYDNKNKRFIYADYNSRVFREFTKIEGASYDITNVGKTLVAADLGMNKAYYMVMKDASKHYFYGYNPNVASPADGSHEISNSPGIEQATGFAASSALKHLYYTTNEAIYLYDILANSSRKVYEFGQGKKIKAIQMYKSKGWGTFVDPLYNSRLVVATYDGAQGEVFFFDLTPTGDVLGGQYTKSFGGFGDIVQLNYRNPS